MLLVKFGNINTESVTEISFQMSGSFPVGPSQCIVY